MRSLLTSFLLVIVALVRGATVTDLVQNAVLKIPTNAALVFTPISAPLWVDGVLTTGDPQGTRVDRYGRISIDLAGGYYSLQIGTNSRRFTVGVPPGTGTYQLAQLVSNTIAFLTNVPPLLYEVNTNKGRANGYASLGADGLVPAEQLPAGNGGGGGGGVGSFYTNNVLATSSATQLGAINGTNTTVSAIVAGSRVTFSFNAIPPRVSAGSGIFVTNQGGSNFIVAGSITAAEFTALTNAVAGLTNLVAAKEGTNNSTHFGYLRFPRTNDYLDFNQTWNIRRYPDDTLHFDYPDVAATPLLIRPNGITVSNIYIPSTNVFIQWNGVWSLVAWADGSFRLLNDDTGTTPFSVGSDGTVTAPAFVGDGSGLTGLPGLSGLAELHFENESGSPTPGDAIIFRSGGRVWIQNIGGSQTDLEEVATTAATAASVAASKQAGSAGLTNIAGTGAITNLVNGSTNGSGWVGLIRSTNNGNAVLKTLSAGLYLVLTNQGTNVVYAIDWSTFTNGIVTLLSNGVPVLAADLFTISNLLVSSWAKFSGTVTNAGAVYLTGIGGSGPHLTIDADGGVTRTTITGGSGSSAWNETNIVISGTNNFIWDVGAFDRAKVKPLTNLNLCILTNVSSMTKVAQLLWQQDTTGCRTVRFAVAGGRWETNGLTEPTTNANKLSIIEITQSTFPTNAAVKAMTTNITAEPFTNSLASAGGGGGGTTYLIDEGWEGAGRPANWSDSIGAPDYDYTGTVLAGSQSLQLQAGSGERAFFTSSPDWAAPELYGSFEVQFTEIGSFDNWFEIWDSSFDQVFTLQIDSGNVIKATCGSGSGSTVATVTTGVHYWFWWHYLKGTGADAVVEVWFSTTSSKPANGSNNHKQVTNGSKTANVSYLSFSNGDGAGGTDNVVDSVKVAATSF